MVLLKLETEECWNNLADNVHFCVSDHVLAIEVYPELCVKESNFQIKVISWNHILAWSGVPM